MKWYDYLNPMKVAKKGMRIAGDFLGGSPEEHERVGNLRPEQEGLYNQLQDAAQAGQGGAFGQAGDYWRDLLSNDSATMSQLSAPEMRNFNENIIPGLSEQFAGMGAGGLSSSGFRNAAVGAGTDLSERLGAIRAKLRENAAHGLMGLGQQGLGNYSHDVMTKPGSPGLLGMIAPALGTAAGAAFGGPAAAYLGNMGGQMLNSGMNAMGGQNVGRNTSWEGQQQQGQNMQVRRY